MKVSILIPAYNEERNIAVTLRGIIDIWQPEYEVTVVADHCTDKTEELVEAMQKTHPDKKILLVRNERKKGFGNALITGMEQSTGDFVVPVMADHCDDPSTIKRMADVLQTSTYDVVCASRYMKGGRKVSGPWIQNKLSRIVCFTLRLFTRIPTRDCANSYKMYRRTFLNTIDYRIADSGTEYSMALLFRAYYAGAKITEIPTTWAGKPIPFLREWRIFRRTAGYWQWYKGAVLQALRYVGVGRK